MQGALVGGFASFRTFQFASVAGLKWNTPQELVTAALSVIGFNLRYTQSVLDHTNAHIPFDNRETVYAGSADDAALNAGIQRWTGDPDAMNYVARYYTPTGALQIPVQTLHTSRDPVVPAWHEDIFAGVVALALGALLFAGALVDNGHEAWIGLVFGPLCAALGWFAVGGLIERVRTRLEPDQAALVTAYADGAALVLAAIAIFVPPLAFLAIPGFVVLLLGSRRREGEKYAGLRILR